MSGPEFGPGGYLPNKAAKRARKIVLREQMGWGWPLAAVAAALLVGGAGVAYVRTSSRPPGPPYAAVAPISRIDAAGASVMTGTSGNVLLHPVLIVRAGGPVRAFAVDDAAGVEWCPASRRLETADAAWNPDGRRSFGDGPSLAPLPSVVFNGIVYVDTANPLPRPAAAPAGQPPVCT